MDLLAEPNPVRLNLGAGPQVLEGYLSVDVSGEPDIKADVRSIPLPDESVDEIMAIHLFEHLPRWDSEKALEEWFRLLKPGGKLILELPDVIKCCQNILNGKEERAGLWGLYGDPSYENELMCHRWAWSEFELARALRSAGFRKVKIREPQFHKKYRDMRLEALK